MPNQKLGVTANELFACNPFRVIGVPVTAEDSDITATYKQLLQNAGTPAADSYKTDFDFPSLPPFRRDETTLRTAYAKLASNGYRCFAFSDGVFTQALNVDDVMLNLQDIQSYDVFLRCYMWLVVNDRSFEEVPLWVLMAKYLDKMIGCSANDRKKYFDNRFSPSAMSKEGDSLLAEFHETFKDIILLPIKEMVRGSMRCTTAMDILRAAKVDVDSTYPPMNIPQANKPAPGQPKPKIKIAVKDGEIVEHNTFTAVASSISADALTSEEAPKPAARPVQPVQPAKPVQPAYTEQPKPKEEHKVSLVDDAIAADAASSAAASASSQRKATTSLVEEEVPVKHVEAVDTLAPRVRPRGAAPKEEPVSDPLVSGAGELDLGLPAPSEKKVESVNISITERPVQQKRDASREVFYVPGASINEDAPNIGESVGTEAVDPFAVAGGTGRTQSAVASSVSGVETAKKRNRSLADLDGLGEQTQPVADLQFTAPAGSASYAPAPEETEENNSNLTERLTLTSLIEKVENKTAETEDQLLTEQEIEDELYTDTLVKLLRSNRSNKMMKDVDTTHVFLNGGGNEGSHKTMGLTMDEMKLGRPI